MLDRSSDDPNAAAEAGKDEPIYVTYDIDFVDPTFKLGTGTSEVVAGGAWSWRSRDEPVP
ncbi:MAG: arginase family protein [Bosea sp. (in: a-proteobacteria)]|jgi:arginase family enzyme